jgi:hypothetical protein
MNFFEGHGNYGEMRRAQLEDGKRFQDWIAWRHYHLGIGLNSLVSEEGQRIGENMLGLEIKHDHKYPGTGNLYIETMEKAVQRAGSYAPSGIFRNDNSWLYGIGDRRLFWTFGIATLRRVWDRREALAENPQWKGLGERENRWKTSRGFVLPVRLADKLCLTRIDFDEHGNIIRRVLGGKQNGHLDVSVKAPDPGQLQFGFDGQLNNKNNNQKREDTNG